MGGQLAKIYLRGTLMSVTAAGLTDEQKQECQDLMDRAWHNPLLQKAKAEFSKALARTIGNEYRDYDAGQQDARLAYWKAAVMVLYHESRNCERCGKHHITSFEPKDTCDRGLIYWCDQIDPEKQRAHGEAKQPIYIDNAWMEKWLLENDIKKANEWLVDQEDEPAIDQILNYSAIGEICPKCHAEGKIHFLFNGACGGELITSWSPKPEIAHEAEFHCPPCNHRWIDHQDNNTCEKCGSTENNLYFVKMKKFFQTVLFNYLKQILRENKPPSIKETREIIRPADVTFLNLIRQILDGGMPSTAMADYEISSKEHTHTIDIETNCLPQQTILELNQAVEEFKPLGVTAEITKAKIHITPLFNLNDEKYVKMLSSKTTKKAFIRFVSLDGQSTKKDDDESNFREFCEFKSGTYKKTLLDGQLVDEMDTISVIKRRLPNGAKAVLDLIVHTPLEYVKRFDTSRVYKAHVAQFLNKPLEEIETYWESIEDECRNVGLTI